MPNPKNLAYSYLLRKIIQIFNETDIKKRHQLYIDFVEERTFILEKNSPIRKISDKENTFYSGFIHPESLIIINQGLVPIQINDDEIYIDLLEKIYTLPKHTLRFILSAVMLVLEDYFGDNWIKNDENKRLGFFQSLMSTEQPINLLELKHKNIAECAEKASVAQNLLIFMGIESKLIISNDCQLDHFGPVNHAFNIVKFKDNEYIFDPSNPQLIFREEGGLEKVLPAYYQIPLKSYHQLREEQGVEVLHQNFIKKGRTYLQKDVSYRIYSA